MPKLAPLQVYSLQNRYFLPHNSILCPHDPNAKLKKYLCSAPPGGNNHNWFGELLNGEWMVLYLSNTERKPLLIPFIHKHTHVYTHLYLLLVSPICNLQYKRTENQLKKKNKKTHVSPGLWLAAVMLSSSNYEDQQGHLQLYQAFKSVLAKSRQAQQRSRK